ncbi:competence protein ComGB [Bacillus sp. TS-2]|nr:competence protein ComGB [Bacillus sp. TS-2]
MIEKKLKKLKVNHMKLSLQLTRISQLMEQGYPLSIALSFMKLHAEPLLQVLYDKVEKELMKGIPVYEAFETFDLPKDVLAFLYFYDKQGNLAKGFEQASIIYQKKEKVKKELSKVLKYPLLLIWLSIIVLILIQQFIVPQLTQLFYSIQNSPPLITSFFFMFIEHIPLFFVVIALCLILLFLFYVFKIRNWSSKKKITCLLAVPGMKRKVKQVVTYFFSLQLGRLIKAGMNVSMALHVFENQNYIVFFSEEVKVMKSEFTQGYSFTEIIMKKSYFTSELALVMENGERTGYLGENLESYGQLLFDEIDSSLKAIITMVQPIFFIMIGFFVLFLFLAVLLPMFNLIGTIQ